MDERLSYNGYVINAEPMELQEPGFWTIRLTIEHPSENGGSWKWFGGPKKQCANKEEVLRHCFAWGKQIIDGKARNCSVAGL